MKTPLELRDPGSKPTAEGRSNRSFVRRRAAVRHHRRSLRARTVAVDVFWVLLLAIAAVVVAGGIIAGFRAA